MMTFSEDGLSVIATKLGTPLVLDSYTSDMCMQSWGRSSYARAMIDLRADEELENSFMVAMPKLMISIDYRVPLGFGSIVGGLDPVNPVIRLLIKLGISSGSMVIRLVLGIVGINHYDLVAPPS
ncbi:hypothetical protein Tco_0574210 [Tanacetum coccineum]